MTWLYLPSTSAKSALASECLVKDCEQGSPTWASRLAPSSTLSGKLTRQQSWLRAAKTDRWTMRLSGPTFSPSTADDFVESWIASLQASRAKTSRSLVDALGLTANDPVSSSTSSTLRMLAVRGASFWRTSQPSLLPPPPLWTRPRVMFSNVPPPESWENWPSAGGTRNGSLFQRPTWAAATAASGGSASHGESWKTPNTLRDSAYTRDRGNPGMERPTLVGQTTTWATPTASENANRTTQPAPSHGARIDGRGHGHVLAGQASGWPSPRVSDGTKGGPNMRGSKGDQMLPSMAAHWPTPRADEHQQQNSQDAGMSTSRMAMLWPTPDASRGGTETPEQIAARRTRSGAGSPPLQTAATFWPTPDTGHERTNRSASPGAATRPNFALAASRWPTPTCGDSESAGGAGSIAAGNRRPTLSSTTEWPTPASRDYRTPNSKTGEERGRETKGEQLPNFVAHHFFLPQDLAIPDGPTSSIAPPTLRLRLSPIFGAWLMGWPLTWVIAEPHASNALGTALFRLRLASHLSNYCGEPERGWRDR